MHGNLPLHPQPAASAGTAEHRHGGHKALAVRLLLSAVLLLACIGIERHAALTLGQLLFLYLLPYLIAGGDVLVKCLGNLLRGRLLDEHFLMTAATAGAFGLAFFPGNGSYFPEAVFVMLFYQLGELFEHLAEGRSRRSISHLMDLKPDIARIEREGETVSVRPEEVLPGETAVIRPGEKVPFDGIVLEGASHLNTIALTGESSPCEVTVEDEVRSGCINLDGPLKIRVLRPLSESTAAKIMELVENAGEHKAKSEKFITKFARIYTPTVVAAALVLALLPPLLSGQFALAFPVWLQRALIFLIVSCPCALVLSVPLSFFGGIGGASAHGILIKGSAFMDTLARLSTVVFDKTGTLTHGVFEVTAIHPDSCDEHRLLHLAAHVERYSNHPIAQSLKEAYPNENDGCTVKNVLEFPGRGLRAEVNGQTVCVGNSALMEENGTEWKPCHKTGTIVHVAIDGIYAGHIVISDRIKPDSAAAVRQLHDMGVDKIVMLTGDRKEVAESVAEETGIDVCFADLLPEDKVRRLERLIAEKPAGSTVAFVGDGINDAPVLARADIGIAMGGLGSDAAIEAADVVIMDDAPSKISTAIRFARRTLSITRQNIVFAIGVKAVVLLLAGFGLAAMWAAVFADVGVMVLAVLNAMRSFAKPPEAVGTSPLPKGNADPRPKD